MTRSLRLLTLLQILKENRYPITAETLADKLQISVRSIYRDINTLRQQGADILAEPGVGYQLKTGLLLPPLMFDENELEALILGLRWVESNGDNVLKTSALRAMGKINSVITATSQQHLKQNTHFVLTTQFRGIDDAIAQILRLSLRKELKAIIHYQDEKKCQTERIIWPIAVGYFKDVQVLVAWCELRQSYRHFRLDRMQSFNLLEENLPYPKHYLLQQWRKELPYHH